MDSLSNKLQQRVLKKALELQKMTQAIKASLPLDCHTHIDVVGINENQLVLLTDSPVWQTRLRMFSQTILDALDQQTQIKLARVKIKLTPPKRPHQVELPAERKLSKSSAALISQTAQSITDPELRQAMLRLAQKSK